MIKVAELDSNGNTVGDSASIPHEFNSLALNILGVSSVLFNGVDARVISTQGNLIGGAIIQIEVAMFNSDGSIATLDSTHYTSVSIGDVRIRITILNWPFCKRNGAGNSNCQDSGVTEVGAKLNLKFQVLYDAGINIPPVSQRSNGGINFGYYKANVISKMSSDSTVKSAPALQLESQDGFSFDISAFQSNAVIDLMISQ
jgi:hypothetical protein